MAEVASLLDSFSALSDSTRARMLWLLDRQELTVSELCSVLQLPQSTVSRHLKTLVDAGWAVSRRDGTNRFYALAPRDRDAARAQIWALTRAQLADRTGVASDLRRLEQTLARRSEASQQFFAASAGQWDRMREELFGREFVTAALIGLLPAEWTIADLGCGTGMLLPTLASHVRTVIGVDASDEMIAAAERRVAGLGNVDLRKASLEALPIDSGSLDAAVMFLVLHHLPAPVPALAEARRVLKPGGRLLIVDMGPHDREDYRQKMGHVWLGFSDDQMRRLLEQVGFTAVRITHLPSAEDAKGPPLFAATATGGLGS